jgi:hypothetical protein
MKCVFKDSKLTKSLFKILTKFSDINIPFIFKKSGLHIQFMDLANVVLIDINLDLDFFESYTCEQDYTAVFANKTLVKLMKYKDNDTISMEKVNNAEISIDIGNRHYIVTLLDIEVELYNADRDKTQSVITRINKEYINYIITNTKNIEASELRMKIDKKSITISAETHDLKFNIKPEGKEIEVLSCNNPVGVSYNFKYIEHIEKFVELAEESFLVYIDESEPLLCEISINNSTSIKGSKSTLRYLLAPKIDDF